MKRLFVLLLVLAACSPINHMFGRQTDKATASMYFNATVLEAPVPVSGDALSLAVKVIGEDGQVMTVMCENNVETMSRCVKAEPGMKVKVNGRLVNREGLVVRADYFALK